MMNFFKNKKTWISIIAPILVQLAILFILIPAIKDMESNIDELSIAVVNEDDHIGTKITKQLQESLPFRVVDEKNEQQAMDNMVKGIYQMVIMIPSTFTKNIQGATPEIDFLINQAVPPTVKSSMNQVAEQITAMMSDKIYEMKKENMQESITGNPTKNEQLYKMVSGIFENLDVKTLDGKVTKIHPVDGSISSIFPLGLFISTFISAIIMVMIHFQSFRGTNKRWFSFAQHQLMNIIAAIIFPIAGWIIICTFDIEISLSLWAFWLFLSLTFWTFTLFVQMFIYLFGVVGQGINAILMLTQAVSCGMIIPIAVLPGFYKWVSGYLPGTYYSKGIYKVLFGGPSLLSPSFMLLLFSGIFLTVTTVTVWLRKGLLR